ncbi:MAG: ABC transporter ATP-binding protein [Crocinitomicaceae bacterium]
MLRIENIVKQYANHRALDDISISTQKGEIFGLLGPNGAGKTSLIRIINQITAPDSGQVFIEGKPIKREDISKIGYLPEERGLYKKMKVGEQALYFARLKGMSKNEAKYKLKEWFDKFDIGAWYDKKIEELSKGMAQKVQFISTILHEPPLLILDEPFSGFDPINTELIKTEIMALKAKGTSIMLSTHNMNSVEEICDSIALINKSKMVLNGKLKDVKEQFNTHTYAVKFNGVMMAFANALWSNFNLIDKEQVDDNIAIAHVQLKNDNTVNDLLKAVMPVVDIISVQEVLPSMNDIFINAVQQVKGGENE